MAKTKQEQLEYLLKLKTDIIENKTNDFFKHLNEATKETIPSLKEYLADFDTVNGKIKNTKFNKAKILGFQKFLYKTLSIDFNIGLKDFQTQFRAIETVNVDIQKINNINVEPSEYLRNFVNDTVIGRMTLTKAVDGSQLATNIQQALSRFTTGEFSRQKAVEEISKLVAKDTSLSRWAKTISIDALREHDGKIQQEFRLASDLYTGAYYNGTLIDTSRPICVYCVGLRYIYFDQFPEIVEKYKNNSGYDANMPLTEDTFLDVCGGHGCRHNMTLGIKRKK